jgi:bacteriocin-like protein
MEKFEELSFEELQEVEGGGFWVGILGGMVGVFLYEVVNDWKNNVEAFNEGYESFK